uniref:Uncharacterized protein n=1 Tax=Aegilops tauschii subsp. strangulata TaxID=200361 RepID=A0A453EAP2_AEGTS
MFTPKLHPKLDTRCAFTYLLSYQKICKVPCSTFGRFFFFHPASEAHTRTFFSSRLLPCTHVCRPIPWRKTSMPPHAKFNGLLSDSPPFGNSSSS